MRGLTGKYARAARLLFEVEEAGLGTTISASTSGPMPPPHRPLPLEDGLRPSIDDLPSATPAFAPSKLSSRFAVPRRTALGPADLASCDTVSTSGELG
jgi:hypothetical protein